MDYSYQNRQKSYFEFLKDVFKWLFIGLGLTTLTSILLAIINMSGVFHFVYYPVMIVSSIVEIAMVFILAKKIQDLSLESAKKYFYAYAIINGISISLLLSLVAPGVSILAFALTCAYFGLLYTITTHTDNEFLGVGRICISALPILIIGYIILFFIHAPALYYGIIFIDLALFTGITLYDLKKMQRMYYQGVDNQLDAIAMMCALELYLDFINIFIDILSLIDDFS